MSTAMAFDYRYSICAPNLVLLSQTPAPIKKPIQDYMDAPKIRAVAHIRLRYCVYVTLADAVGGVA